MKIPNSASLFHGCRLGGKYIVFPVVRVMLEYSEKDVTVYTLRSWIDFPVG
jgi:hypothetical protein